MRIYWFVERTWAKIAIALTLTVITAVVMGLIEPAFFTDWAIIYNEPLNRAWILGHFSWICVGFGLLGAAPLIALIVDSIYDADDTSTRAYVVALAIGVPIWAMIEDFFAHLRYGALPFDDWTHWLWPPFIVLWESFWLPNWYIVVIVITIFVLTGLAVYETKKG